MNYDHSAPVFAVGLAGNTSLIRKRKCADTPRGQCLRGGKRAFVAMLAVVLRVGDIYLHGA